LGWLVAAVRDIGHAAEEDGAAARDTDDDVADIFVGAKELAGLEDVLTVPG
jgi:hypothetical protein